MLQENFWDLSTSKFLRNFFAQDATGENIILLKIKILKIEFFEKKFKKKPDFFKSDYIIGLGSYLGGWTKKWPIVYNYSNIIKTGSSYKMVTNLIKNLNVRIL